MLYFIDLAVAFPFIFFDRKLFVFCLLTGLISSFISRINEPSTYSNSNNIKASVLCFILSSIILLIIFNNFLPLISLLSSIIVKYFFGRKIKIKKKFIVPEDLNYNTNTRRTYDYFKRIIDIVISSLCIILFSPIIAVVAISIKLSTGSPVFIVQNRIGINGQIFPMYKFRTFSNESKNKKITTIGKIIRPLRVDEIPQFINVLKGHMSLVGPRPELPAFHRMASKHVPNYEMRLLVKPGITGWAQINYKYTTSAEEYYKKTGYDFYYVKHRSLLMDIQCLLKTPYAIIRSIISK